MKVNIGPYPDGEEERKISVEIDYYDAWSLDHTLAMIIAPALKVLQEQKQGSPFVDDEDVPDDLKSTAAPPKENEWDTDDNHHKRWDYVLSEMIWAFTEYTTDWEDQFHSGEIDMQFKEVEYGGETMHEMVRGPKDTHVFDKEGYGKHYARIMNGIRLFAKYYGGLWDQMNEQTH